MQENSESVFLVLGCHGREEDTFVLCPGTENRILKLDEEKLVNINGVVDYLEALKLFEKPLLDYNAIRHLTANLQAKFDQKVRRLWTERYYSLIERYTLMHKPCGLYAKLVTAEDTPFQSKMDLTYQVKGIVSEPQKENTPMLKLVRGRR